jgi:hypothetical protein
VAGEEICTRLLQQVLEQAENFSGVRCVPMPTRSARLLLPCRLGPVSLVLCCTFSGELGGRRRDEAWEAHWMTRTYRHDLARSGEPIGLRAGGADLVLGGPEVRARAHRQHRGALGHVSLLMLKLSTWEGLGDGLTVASAHGRGVIREPMAALLAYNMTTGVEAEGG